MRKNGRCRMKQDLIKMFNIKSVDARSPIDENSRIFVDMQLEIAKIVMCDARKELLNHPEKNLQEVVDGFAQIWKDNIKNFAMALLISEKE